MARAEEVRGGAGGETREAAGSHRDLEPHVDFILSNRKPLG